MMFAQAASNLDGDLLVKIVVLGIAIGQFFTLWLGISNRNSMQKREVSFGFEPASKENFDRLVTENGSEHRDIFAKIGGVERGAAKKISEEVVALHHRVNGLEKSVGGLETSSNLTNQPLAQIDAKSDRLIERS